MYYSHPHFADEITEAGESKLSRVTSLAVERQNQKQCARALRPLLRYAHPLWASMSHL